MPWGFSNSVGLLPFPSLRDTKNDFIHFSETSIKFSIKLAFILGEKKKKTTTPEDMPFNTFPWGYRRMFWNQSNFRRLKKFKKFPDSPDWQFLGWEMNMHQMFQCLRLFPIHSSQVSVSWAHPGRSRDVIYFFANSSCTEQDCEKQERPLFLWFLENGVDIRPHWARPRRCELLTSLFALRE